MSIGSRPWTLVSQHYVVSQSSGISLTAPGSMQLKILELSTTPKIYGLAIIRQNTAIDKLKKPTMI